MIRVANVEIQTGIVANVSVWDGIAPTKPLPGCIRIPLDDSERQVFRGWTYDPARVPRFEPSVDSLDV